MPDDLTQQFTSYAATLTPATPADFSGVRRAATRRKRRRTAAVGVTCAAVVAIAVPFAFTTGGDRRPAPLGPPTLSPLSPTPAPLAPTPAPSVSTVVPPPASSAVSPALSSSVVTTDAGVVQLTFPPGPPPALPLMLVSGKDSQLTLIKSGSSVEVGSFRSELRGPLVSTPSGIVMVADNGVSLLTPDGRVVLLGKGYSEGAVVSADGRYVAWGVQVVGPKGAVSGVYVLYDLHLRRIVHQVASATEGGPVGFLDDGRVAIHTGDGGVTGAQLWQPATGAITTLAPKYLGVTFASGHTLALMESDNYCASVLQDTRTSALTRVPGCQVLGAASPDGTRFLAVDGSVELGLDLPPGLMDRATGKHDPRLASVLKAAGVRTAQGAWLDNEHVLLSVVRGIKGSKDLRAMALTCAVPPNGEPTCTVSQDFGPVVTDSSSAPRPPRPEVYVVERS